MSSKSFLVVDDSKVVRHIACDILNQLGFETDQADDGDTALVSCKESMPDAILLDWNMPRVDGITFMRELRVTPGGDKPTILFCTANKDLEDVQKALLEGADEYIMTPFDEDIMRAKLSEVGLL